MLVGCLPSAPSFPEVYPAVPSIETTQIGVIERDDHDRVLGSLTGSADGPIRWELVHGPTGLRIDPNGTVHMAKGAAFDYEASRLQWMTVRAIAGDEGGARNATEQKVALLVQDVLEPTPPMGHLQEITWQRSLYEHNRRAEVQAAPTKVGTIAQGGFVIYPDALQHERELLDYDPRYLPAVPAFDRENLPYLQVAHYNQLDRVPRHSLIAGEGFAGSDDGYLLHLDASREWSSVALSTLVAKVGGRVLSNHRGNADRLTFDVHGDMWLRTEDNVLAWRDDEQLFESYSFGNVGGATLYSTAGGGVGLIKDFYEQTDAWVQRDTTFQAHKGLVLDADVDRLSCGVVTFPGSMIASFSSYNTDASTVIDDLKPDATVAQTQGTVPQGVARLRADGTIEGPVWLGNTDNLQQPCIWQDHDDRLHLLIGPRSDKLWYRHSLLPVTDPDFSLDAWSTPVAIGITRSNARAPSASVSKQGVVLVSYSAQLRDRDRASPNYHPSFGRGLILLRGLPTAEGGLAWQDLGTMLENERNQNSYFNHRITHDRNGTAYMYLAHQAKQLQGAEISDHAARWPNDPLDDNDSQRHARDPALWASEDFGQTWNLVTTEDLLRRASSDPRVILSHASATQGTAPLPVRFTGIVKGGTGAESTVWVLPNGERVASTWAEYTFHAAGHYEVVLEVDDGVHKDTRTVIVEVSGK